MEIAEPVLIGPYRFSVPRAFEAKQPTGITDSEHLQLLGPKRGNFGKVAPITCASARKETPTVTCTQVGYLSIMIGTAMGSKNVHSGQ